MKTIALLFLAVGLSLNLSADDKYKDKSKSRTIDPITGETVKTKDRAKVEHDGDYKAKGEVVVKDRHGKKSKSKYKEKAEPDGTYKSKTKIER